MMILAFSASETVTQGGSKCIIRLIFGGARRKLSDRYGLTVTLCSECHRTGDYAVHRNADTMQYLHEYGQRKAMQENGWTADEFRQVFGKNYLDTE